MDKIFRQVKSHERSPEKNGTYHTNRCLLTFENNGVGWTDGAGKTEKPYYWYEEINLGHIENKRELTATVLVNAVRSLDEQGARHLVKELCERFHLLPSDEEIKQVRDSYSYSYLDPFRWGWKYGVKYILNALKGGKNEV